MNLETFIGERQRSWSELDELLALAHGRPERLGPEGVLSLGRLYRGAAADLALARRRFPSEPVVVRLEQLVARARSGVYVSEARHRGGLRYLTTGYWQAVHERRRYVAIAWVLLLAPFALAMAWGAHDPGAAAGIVPFSLAAAAGPHHAIGLSGAQSAGVAISIFTNNIRVSLLTFASGIAFGLGSALELAYNGALPGALTGIATSGGHAQVIAALLLPHGVLELSCIVVCGAAGMRMGWTLIEPGPRTRTRALAAEAASASMVALCTAPWLILAGCVEGFVTPRTLSLTGALIVGIAVAAPYWTLVVWRGRQ